MSRALLDSLGTDPPQVAILDVEADETAEGCSVTEGLSLLREARKRRLEVRMLMLSAVSTPEIISQCFDEGASGYLFRVGLGVGSVVYCHPGAGEGRAAVPRAAAAQRLRATAGDVSACQRAARAHAARARGAAYVAGGADNLKIAAHLQIAERTVKSHVTQLYRKLGAENRTQLALRACHLGVRPPPDL